MGLHIPNHQGTLFFVEAEKIAKVFFKLKFEAMEKLKDDFQNSARMLLPRQNTQILILSRFSSGGATPNLLGQKLVT